MQIIAYDGVQFLHLFRLRDVFHVVKRVGNAERGIFVLSVSVIGQQVDPRKTGHFVCNLQNLFDMAGIVGYPGKDHAAQRDRNAAFVQRGKKSRALFFANFLWKFCGRLRGRFIGKILPDSSLRRVIFAGVFVRREAGCGQHLRNSCLAGAAGSIYRAFAGRAARFVWQRAEKVAIQAVMFRILRYVLQN